MWELASCGPDRVEKFLDEGWEPFAVTSDRFNQERTIWLRRKKK